MFISDAHLPMHVHVKNSDGKAKTTSPALLHNYNDNVIMKRNAALMGKHQRGVQVVEKIVIPMLSGDMF